MGADEYIEAREEGATEALEDLADNPAEVFRVLMPYQWQDWFDRLKAEAVRLGVRV
jgi:hypothetical protein